MKGQEWLADGLTMIVRWNRNQLTTLHGFRSDLLRWGWSEPQIDAAIARAKVRAETTIYSFDECLEAERDQMMGPSFTVPCPDYPRDSPAPPDPVQIARQRSKRDVERKRGHGRGKRRGGAHDER